MNCRKTEEVAFQYTDEELGGELLIAFRQHITVCPECARRVSHVRRLVTVVRTRCTRAVASAQLRQRILTELPHRRTQREVEGE